MKLLSQILILLILLGIIPGSALTGYTQSSSSSLSNETKSEGSIEKVNELINLSRVLRYSNRDSSLLCCDLAIALSESLDYQKGIAEAYYKKCLAMSVYGDLKLAYDYVLKTLEIANDLQDSMLLAKAYYKIGGLRTIQGYHTMAINNFRQALRIYESFQDTARITAVYNGLGGAFENASMHDSAAYYYHNALIMAEALENDSYICKVSGNLGKVYTRLSEFELSEKYLSKSLNLARQLGNNVEMANNFSRLSGLNIEMLEYEKALEHLFQADSLYKASGDEQGISNILVNTAIVYRKQGKFDLARKNLEQALKYYREQNHAEGLMVTWQILAELYDLEGEKESALTYYDSSLVLAEKAGDGRRMMENYWKLFLLYSSEEDYKNALHYHTLLRTLEDSLFDIGKIQLGYELDLIFDLKEKNIEETVRREEILKRTRQRKQILYPAIGLIMIAIFLIIFFRYRARKNQVIAEQKIRQLEEERKFLAARFLVEGQEKERVRIATAIHDSLGVLLSASKMHVSAIKDKNPENEERIKKATQFLDEASGEMRKISHNMMPGLLTKMGLIEALEDLFERINDSENIDARMDVVGPREERLTENQEIMIYRIIQEMVNNTLKHAEAKRMDLTIVIHPDELDISFADDGKGFDVNSVLEGQSMGIQNIRNRVSFLEGNFNVKSNGKGTFYNLVIPR